jgi:DNA-binding transcriptional LysR family regulator
MRFTLAQIETFFWIAQLGSFQAAARRLNLAQPTVSLRIRELEQALGAALLERRGRRVALTAEGAALRADAEHLLALAGRIEARRAAGGPLRGILRFGAPESFALVCLPSLLARLEAAHPELVLEATIATSDELMALVEDDRLDLAVLTNPSSRDADLRVEPLGRHEMAWVASPALPLPVPVRPQDLQPFTVISNPRPSPMFRIILDWCRTAGLEPLRVNACNSLAVIARLVAAGVGVSILPPAILADELAQGQLRTCPARPPLPIATMCAVHRLSRPSPAIAPVLEACREVLRATGFLQPLG